MIMSNQFGPTSQLIASSVLAVTILVAAPTVRTQEEKGGRKAAPRAKPAAADPSGAEWYSFRGPDKDFIISFPTVPQRADDVQGPVTILRRYVAAADNIYFEISIQDIGGVPDSPEANEFGPKFEQNLSALLTDDGFRIVQLRRTAKNVYEMEAWSPAATPGDFLHNLARGIIHKGRTYRMGCNSLLAEQEVDERICRRFFDSFRITGHHRSLRGSKE